MTLQEYINGFAKKKVKADIITRWKTRVVDGGLSLDASGARAYLANYGTAIGAEKAVGFALQAQSLGHDEMAMEFWRKAYTLEFKTVPTSEAVVGTTAGRVEVVNLATPFMPFPADMQPGSIVTMQPVDGEIGIVAIINDPDYVAQPKRDGRKFLFFATGNLVICQTRQMRVVDCPSTDMESALKRAADVYGPFIIETEVYYTSADEKEHRTGAQAATWNSRKGLSGVQIHCATFSVLYANEQDLRTYTQHRRLEKAATISTLLHSESSIFEVLPIVRGAEQKQALVDAQQRSGREGVVFSHMDASYHAGKQGNSILRYKFLTESVVRVTGLQPTSADGKMFGAIEIVSDVGEALGRIGTGYSREDEREISAAFSANPTDTWIEIVHQGYTENGVIWHGRFQCLK